MSCIEVWCLGDPEALGGSFGRDSSWTSHPTSFLRQRLWFLCLMSEPLEFPIVEVLYA